MSCINEKNIVDLLRKRAELQADEVAFRFLSKAGKKEQKITYKELDLWARNIAANLCKSGVPGDRIILFIPPSLEYIAAFLGCLYAGRVAVPVYPPRKKDKHSRLAALIENCNAKIALSFGTSYESIKPLLVASGAYKEEQIINLDSLTDDLLAQNSSLHTEQTLAFLQYTSGSTGSPKGVMISHLNIIENSQALADNANCSSDDVFVNWLPLFHDLGLITTIMLPLYLGAPSVIMSPTEFIINPETWLNAITKYGGTVCGAPNFAFDLCNKKLTSANIEQLDLSSWRVAYNAAEPIRVETLHRFIDKFSPAGFKAGSLFPAYGMAEATVFISGGNDLSAPLIKSFSKSDLQQKIVTLADDPLDIRELVGCGKVSDRHEIVIVDPQTLKPLAGGSVGEIWLQGPSVGMGYWKSEKQTVEAFNGIIKGREKDGHFLRTGDLGFIFEDEIFVAGRIKDVIIIHGVNYYPQDIELVAEKAIRDAVPLGLSAAFSSNIENEEKLHLIMEVKLGKDNSEDLNQYNEKIRYVVAEEFGIEIHSLLFVKPGIILKTSSGKVQRLNCKNLYLNNQLVTLKAFTMQKVVSSQVPQFINRTIFKELDQDKRNALLMSFLKYELSTLVNVDFDAVVWDTPVLSLGINSLKAVQLMNNFEQKLEVTLDVSDLLQNATMGSLISVLSNELLAEPEVVEIIDNRDRAPQLSIGQRSLWALHQQSPDNHAYNISKAIKVVSSLDIMALQRALDALVARHDSLRTVFKNVNGEPECEISSTLYLSVELKQSILDEEILKAELQNQSKIPFDLENGPLIRLQVYPVNNAHVLFINVHHIVVDFRSLDIMFSELGQLYDHFKFARQLNLKNIDASYQDFAYWQQEYLNSQKGLEDRAYWQASLQDNIEALVIPTDHPRSREQTFEGESLSLRIEADLVYDITAFCQKEGVTLNTFMLTGYQILLNRYSGQNSVVIGTPFLGRSKQIFSDIIGYCVNSLPIALRLDCDETTSELVKRNSHTLMSAFKHQNYPLSQIVSDLGIMRDPARSPLFNTLFVYQNSMSSDSKITDLMSGNSTVKVFLSEGLEVEAFPIEEQGAQFELAMEILDSETQLTAVLKFNTDLYSTCSAQKLLAHYRNTLSAMLEGPSNPVKRLSILDDAEEQRLINDSDQTQTDFPENACIHQLFEQQVSKLSDKVAVSLDGRTLTYKQLDQRSNQLAAFLIEQGVEPDSLVGLCCERSFEMIIGILGIMKAGGAYVPLDPDYPLTRLEYLLEDSGTDIVLAQSHLAGQLPIRDHQLFILNDELTKNYGSEKSALRKELRSTHLAYMIYTSGSTGAPKGVMVEHQALVNRLDWMKNHYQFDHNDRILQKTPYSFDVSVWELLLPLITGAMLVFSRPDGHKDADYLSNLITQECITALHFVPSMLSAMLPELSLNETSYLKKVFCSGEALSVDLQQRFFSSVKGNVELHNLYGPTEAAIDVTYWQCKPDSKLSCIPIGRAINNTSLYILDQHMQLVPPGGMGELHIGGLGLARGYRNKPELTAEKFVANPFSNNLHNRLYKTGDLVRWLPGEQSLGEVIEYLGRIDHQVKIRGFRVELGEIEAGLLALDAVSDAVVIDWDTDLNKFLAAYIVFNDEFVSQDSESVYIRKALALSLPEYMIPATITVLDALPLTANGKVNRQALSEPTIDKCSDYVAPSSAEEKALVNIWSQMLNIESCDIGIQDNFFTLGGDSIKAIKVVSLAKHAGYNFSVSDLFNARTIANLSKVDNQSQASIEQTNNFSLIPEQTSARFPKDIVDAYPLSSLQKGMAFHSQFAPESPVYHDVFSFHLNSPWNEQCFIRALDSLIKSHPVLRSHFELDLDPPLQLIHETVAAPLTVIDLSNSLDPQKDINTFLEREKYQSFNWQEPALFKVFVHIRNASEFEYTLSFHHAILDGWSVATFNSLLFKQYFKMLEGKAGDEAVINTLHRAFVSQELDAISSKQSIEYWQHKLVDADVYRFDRKLGNSDTGSATYKVEGLASLSAPLMAIARKMGVPLAHILLAVHVRVVSLKSGSSDVTTCIVSNGRAEKMESEQALGLFLNSLPIRVNTQVNDWRTLATKVSEAANDILPYRHFPVAEVQRVSGLNFSDFLFNFNHFHSYDELVEDDKFKLLGMNIFEENNFNLYVNFQRSVIDGQLSLEFTYRRQYLSLEDIKNLESYYLKAAQSLVSDLDGLIKNEEFFSEPELKLIAQWQPKNDESTSELCCHELFMQQVQRTPDSIAAIAGNISYTYRELNVRADKIAHLLTRQGVQPGELVAICLERNELLLGTLIGIMKVGAAYVPLDPSYPRTRLEYMLEDSQVKYLVTGQGLCDWLHQKVKVTLCLDDEIVKKQLVSLPDVAFTNPNSADPLSDLAYVIYTSGSTGLPKGVMVENGNLSNFLTSMQLNPGITETDCLLAVTPISFDIHVLELFLPLISGACVVLADTQQAGSPEILEKLIYDHSISIMQATPATWKMLLLNGWLPSKPLKVLCGGEALVEGLKHDLLCLDAIELWNMYGPTETTVWSSIACIQDLIHLGSPIANTQFYILDQQLQPVPPHSIGELYIGGKGVARGYLNNPELTQERFVDNPWNQGTRIYRTGDRVRINTAGLLEYISRADDQVKVRGFRIELKEIEEQLEQILVINQAVVVVSGDEENKHLVAFVVIREGDEFDVEQLSAMLRKRLPEYMVPSKFVEYPSIPLTPNGKVDRKTLTLTAMEFDLRARYEAPNTPKEIKLCELWTELFGIEKLGVHDDFFVLGGHSLMATRLINLIREHMNIEVPVKSIFEYTTIARLALHLSEKDQTCFTRKLPGFPKPAFSQTMEVSFAQQRLWFLNQLEQGSSQYNLSGQYRLIGSLNISALEKAFQSIIERHHILRTVYLENNAELEVRLIQSTGFRLNTIDLANMKERRQQEQISSLIEDNTQITFDLSSDLMLRAELARIAHDQYIVVVCMHHIASDGWSMGVLINELNALYNSFIDQRSDPLPDVSYQYSDFARWQKSWLTDNYLKADLDYWKDNLENIPPTHSLALDYSRPAVQQFNGGSVGHKVSSKKLAKLQALCVTTETTLFTLLETAFALFIGRYTNEKDIVVGTPVAGRVHQNLDPMIGFFSNTLVLRTQLENEQSFLELLETNKQTILNAFSHQNLPFDRLVNELQVERSLSYSPLFQIFFTFNNNEATKIALKGLETEELKSDIKISKFDFELVIHQQDNGLSFDWIFNTELFQKDSVSRMARNFDVMLNAIIERPETSALYLPLLSEEEKLDVISLWNKTDLEYDRNALIHERFEEWVIEQPEAIAAVYADKALTYSQLNSRANQLARYLMSQDISPGSLVGVCVERSLDMLVAVLAILKAGGAYVPIDPAYPESRIRYVIGDSDLALVISDIKNRAKVVAANTLLIIDDTDISLIISELAVKDVSRNQNQLTSKSLAYVIYTSGSTGLPKGVMVEHQNLVNFLVGMQQDIDMTGGQWLAATSLSFDISIFELLCPLASGFKVVIAPEQRAKSSSSLQHTDKEMEFSLFYFASDEGEPLDNKYQLLLEGAKFADANQFKAIWTPERHFGEFGGLYPNPAITASALAVTTEKIEIRAGSCVLPLHSPIRVVEDWSVVDNLSNGRVGIAFASGWQHNDFVIAPENFESRQDILRENMLSVKALWRGDPVEILGPFGKPIAVQTKPRPIQSELPCWMTIAGNPKAFSAAGTAGNHVLTHLLGQTKEDLADKISLYRQAWKEAGHQGQGIVTLMLHTFVSDNDDYVLEQVEAPFKKYLKQSLALLEGTALSMGMKMDDLTCESLEILLDAAFKRYYQTSAIFGTPETCLQLVDDMKGIGVNEIACLLDFGVNNVTVLDNLKHLNSLRQQAEPQPEVVKAESISQLIQSHQITHFQCTPSLMTSLLSDESNFEALGQLQHLMIGGEALSEKVCNDIHAHVISRGAQVQVTNMYGPTETTIWSTTHPVGFEQSDIGIGRPIANTQVYVVDEFMQASPVGVAGELMIGGEGVARGYLNRDSLTQEKFIANTLDINHKDRLYRTGDLVRWRPDGTLAYIGRTDNQVKLRGFRIELGEIETQLAKLDLVQTAVVVIRQLNDEPQLVAYVTLSTVMSDEEVQIKKIIRTKLSKRMPDFMVPTFFVLLTEMPLTPNGKLDRKALPDPLITNQDEYVAPRDDLEQKLADIWQQLLGIEKVGIFDNFFELGGHSILGTRLIGLVRKAINIELPLRTLFESPDIASLAIALEGLKGEFVIPDIAQIKDRKQLILSYSQNRLWMIDRLGGGSVEYNKQGSIQLDGELNVHALKHAMQTIIERHQVLRTSFEELGEQVFQRVMKEFELPIEELDFSSLDMQEQRFKLTEVAAQDAVKAFDLAKDIKLRLILIKLSHTEHVLLFNMHHIASDAWSLPIMTRELTALYSSFSRGESNPLPALRVQYADFAQWQRDWLKDSILGKQKDYWRQRLANISKVHSLPLDKPRSELANYHGKAYYQNIPETELSNIKSICQQQDVTLFMLLHTAYSLLLSYHSDQNDIVVGTPVSGRVHEDIEPLIGFFVNTLVLRSEFSAESSIVDLLKAEKKSVLDAFAHQYVPFDQIVEELKPERNLSYNPVFQLWFVLQNYEDSSMELPGLSIKPMKQESHLSLFELALDITETSDALSLNWTYKREIFNPRTIENLASDYQQILSMIYFDVNITLKEITQNLDELQHERIAKAKEALRGSRTRKRTRREMV